MFTAVDSTLVDTNSLATRVRVTRRRLDQEVGEARAVALSGKRLQGQVAELQASVALLEQVTAVLGRVGEERQSAAQAQVEALVTRGLQTIFGEDLSFHLIPGVRGKSPVIDFIIRTTLSNGKVIDTSVLDARGGGLAVVVSFLLRLVILLLSRDKSENILFLDESFSHVSSGYIELLAEFLKEVVDKTSVQIVLVTHQEEFAEAGDCVYKFSLDSDGMTKVVKEK